MARLTPESDLILYRTVGRLIREYGRITDSLRTLKAANDAEKQLLDAEKAKVIEAARSIFRENGTIAHPYGRIEESESEATSSPGDAALLAFADLYCPEAIKSTTSVSALVAAGAFWTRDPIRTAEAGKGAWVDSLRWNASVPAIDESTGEIVVDDEGKPITMVATLDVGVYRTTTRTARIAVGKFAPATYPEGAGDE